jgi:hypothetical protein
MVEGYEENSSSEPRRVSRPQLESTWSAELVAERRRAGLGAAEGRDRRTLDTRRPRRGRGSGASGSSVRVGTGPPRGGEGGLEREEAAGPGAGPAALWSRGRGVRRDPQGGEEGWRWKAVRVLRFVLGSPFGRNKRMPPGGAGVVSGVWRCRGVPGRLPAGRAGPARTSRRPEVGTVRNGSDERPRAALGRAVPVSPPRKRASPGSRPLKARSARVRGAGRQPTWSTRPRRG